MWIYCGRAILGFVSGSLSIIVPLYTTEIGEKERRGALGSYFQLQVTTGIAVAYTIGSFVCLYFRISLISWPFITYQNRI